MKGTLLLRRETGRGNAGAQESRGSRRARRGRLGFCSLRALLVELAFLLKFQIIEIFNFLIKFLFSNHLMNICINKITITRNEQK